MSHPRVQIVRQCRDCKQLDHQGYPNNRERSSKSGRCEVLNREVGWEIPPDCPLSGYFKDGSMADIVDYEWGGVEVKL